ncbi:PNPLA domain-containing protein [Aphelenchoides besseyi]|nr:PNPLA domain-containing protein [Aphelenchoides besseyi]KAI6200867.1 PNPLA domain-containing protein [Aphelenchoides besseyi]
MDTTHKHETPRHPIPTGACGDATNTSLSFAGCGFLCIYHAGVCAAIKEYAPQLTKNKMYGASAGSIVAAGLICNVCISEATILMLKAVSQAQANVLQTLSPNFDLNGIVRDGLNRMLPPNAHELCSGRLFISLTRYRDFKNIVVSEFKTRDELIQAILCSSFIPFYSGWQPPIYRGEAYCDGGLSDNQPVYDVNTITVSPFSGESDICPSDEDSASILGVDFYNTSIRLTTQNLFRMFTTLFPPSLEICSKICRQGFQDALVLLNKRGFAPCVRCLIIKSNMVPVPQNQSVTRIRNQSLISNKSRRRLESECEVCFEDTGFRSDDATALFPPILQDAIDDARAAESRFFTYLNSFRLFRWSRRFATPAMVPFDFAKFTYRTIQNWFSSASTADFFIQRFYSTLDFVLSEIAKHNLLYSSQISCQYSLVDIDRRRGSLLRGGSMKRPADPESASAEQVFYGEATDEDSVQRLVEYSKEHDAVLSFYYTDESNKVQVCEIFNTHNQRKPRAKRSIASRPSRLSRTFETLKEDVPVSIDDAQTSNWGEDSGLSLNEDSCGGADFQTKRDPLGSYSNTNSRKNALVGALEMGHGDFRRHTIAGTRRAQQPSLHSGKSNASTLQTNPIFSDSDPENGEQYFRPRSNCSNAYDGEPEQSD